MPLARKRRPASGARAVVDELLRRKLLTVDDVLDRQVRAREGGGRNVHYTVTWRGTAGLFVKRAATGDRDAAKGVALEGALYAFAARPANVALTSVMPELAFFGPPHSLLATRLMMGVPAAGDPVPTDASMPRREIAAELARALAAYHSAVRQKPRLHSARLPATPPWILTVHRPELDWLAELSAAQILLIGSIQDNRAVCDALDELNDSWRPSALVHGDIKWANIVAGAAEDGVRLVDWECAAWGDPMWDVGAAFHLFLLDAFAGEDWDESARLDRARAAFVRALPVAQARIRRFWGAYVAASESRIKPEALRATRFCAASLIQAAYEWSASDEHLSPPALAALQLAINVLLRPREAATRVLGLVSVD